MAFRGFSQQAPHRVSEQADCLLAAFKGKKLKGKNDNVRLLDLSYEMFPPHSKMKPLRAQPRLLNEHQECPTGLPTGLTRRHGGCGTGRTVTRCGRQRPPTKLSRHVRLWPPRCARKDTDASMRKSLFH